MWRKQKENRRIKNASLFAEGGQEELSKDIYLFWLLVSSDEK